MGGPVRGGVDQPFVSFSGVVRVSVGWGVWLAIPGAVSRTLCLRAVGLGDAPSILLFPVSPCIPLQPGAGVFIDFRGGGSVQPGAARRSARGFARATGEQRGIFLGESGRRPVRFYPRGGMFPVDQLRVEHLGHG